MFSKCVNCEREGNDCILKLLLMPLPDLVNWCIRTQKMLGWSNQTLADKRDVPVGTITRIKAGHYKDCMFSTMRNIILSLLEGISADFPCPAIEPGVQHILLLEQQAAKLSAVEKENEELKRKLSQSDELHRKDVKAVHDEYREQIAFLLEELKAWRELKHR